MGARYGLDAVHKAAREGRLELDEARARDEVGRFFATFLECYAFTAAVLLELREGDWASRVVLPNRPHAGEYDVYGIELTRTLAARHKVPLREWYLKLRLYEGLSGEAVFLVSFHPLEFPLRRRAGTLTPGGQP